MAEGRPAAARLQRSHLALRLRRAAGRAAGLTWRRLPARVQEALRRAGVARLGSALAAGEQEYEPELRAALRALVQPGAICADVGAHHGVLTRLMADCAGAAGRVVAFEAHPDNAAVLRDRFSRYRGGRVTIENLAVGDGASPRVWLHAGRGHASTEWNILGADVDGRATPPELEVEATSLDDYFAARGTRVDVVKVDVEGAEADVLRGMRRLLREDRPALAVEFHTDAGWEGRRELLEAGYDLYTTDGTKLEPGAAAARLYHCLALPAEHPFPEPLPG